MEDISLQRTLREKYNINERLLAEGRFVGLIGDHAANLVCLGLGSTFVVVARLVLSGEELDYDVLSLTPLSVVSIAVQNSSKKVKIQSPFQPTQVFQQCSGANQAEIWENFTSTIEQVYAPVYGDRWISTPLKPPDYPDHIRHSMRESEISSTIPTSHHYSFSPLKSNRSFSRSQRIHTRFSESSVSLPNIFSQTDDKFPRYQTVHKCNSLNCLDELEFDSFVNDAQTRFREYNAHDATNYRNDSSDDKVEPNNPKVNISNNSINPLSSMITQEQSSALKQPGGIQKFFGWIFNCCRSDKK